MDLFDNPAWLRSLDLLERVAPSGMTSEHWGTIENPDIAQWRLRQWKQQTPFENERLFHKRLESDGLTFVEFHRLLGESERSLYLRKDPPEWLQELREAYSGLPSPSRFRLPIIEPLFARTFQVLEVDLKRLADEYDHLPFLVENALEWARRVVLLRVDHWLQRVVVLEMRLADLKGELHGNAPEARFTKFLHRYREPQSALRILQQYPVLARILTEYLPRWAMAVSEFFRRLANDWSEVCGYFWKAIDPGKLSRWNFGAGDTHRLGRSVCLLEFESGARLLYKPRSLAIDASFKALLAWLEARWGIDIRVPRVLDRGSHGWCEFIGATSCTDLQQVERFYERQGGLLAILHVLGASDFHRENMVAEGEYPVPVDLETLLAPDYGQFQPQYYDTKAEYELQNSVARVMLLPFFREGSDRQLLDLSGLGGKGGQLTIKEQSEWTGRGTDRLRMEVKRRPLEELSNRPVLGGRPLSAVKFTPQIEAGFEVMYCLLMQHRRVLLQPNSPLAAMAAVSIRTVFRTTAFYEAILEKINHPDYLRDALDRDRLLDRLWFRMDRSRFPKVAQVLIPHERKDLAAGDVPYFWTRADSRDLWSSRDVRLVNFFERSGLEVARERLDALGPEDLNKQLRFIRGSMVGLLMNEQPSFEQYALRTPEEAASPQRLLKEANLLAEHLTSTALWQHDGASWLGLARGVRHGWYQRSLRADLYGGIPGVVLFLAQAGYVLERESFQGTARGGLISLRHILSKPISGLNDPGMFDGWGGLLFLYVRLADLWRDVSLLEDAEELIPIILSLGLEDPHHDVMQGSAGAIVALLAFHEVTNSVRALAAAQALGDRLVAQARVMGQGKAWIGRVYDKPFAGFGHGASGVAWALCRLFERTGEENYRRCALAAATFERELLDFKEGNWLDLRHGRKGGEGVAPKFMAAWCHGACGIGLSRLEMSRVLDDPLVREDLQIALETTYRTGFGSNHCLCHGDFGSLELLYQASCQLGEPWTIRYQERLDQVVSTLCNLGWLCGVPLQNETPGLMDGLSGIGYQLLRLGRTDIPSILTPTLRPADTSTQLPGKEQLRCCL